MAGAEGRRWSTRSPTSRSAASARARGGFATPDAPAPHRHRSPTVRTDHEAYFLLQNLMLMGEALRLGGWVHGAPMIPHVWQPRPGDGLPRPRLPRAPGQAGAGALARWPPVPASQPNFVGIDGVLEGLCPPYVTDMDAAVDQVIEEKFGAGGAYADAGGLRPGLRDRGSAETLPAARRPPAGGDRVHEGDLPLPGRDLRPLPGAHRRLPPAGHLGAVLAPGDRVLRALRQPRPRAPRGRGQGDLGAADSARPRHQGNTIGRMTGLTLFTPDPPAVAVVPAVGFFGGRFPMAQTAHPPVRLHPLRALGDRRRACRASG